MKEDEQLAPGSGSSGVSVHWDETARLQRSVGRLWFALSIVTATALGGLAALARTVGSIGGLERRVASQVRTDLESGLVTRGLAVVDDEGRLRAELRAERDGEVRFVLFDESLVPRVAIGLLATGEVTPPELELVPLDASAGAHGASESPGLQDMTRAEDRAADGDHPGSAGEAARGDDR